MTEIETFTVEDLEGNEYTVQCWHPQIKKHTRNGLQDVPDYGVREYAILQPDGRLVPIDVIEGKGQREFYRPDNGDLLRRK